MRVGGVGLEFGVLRRQFGVVLLIFEVGGRWQGLG